MSISNSHNPYTAMSYFLLLLIKIQQFFHPPLKSYSRILIVAVGVISADEVVTLTAELLLITRLYLDQQDN